MDVGYAQVQQLRQTQRMIPEQILAGEILRLPRLELEERVEREFEQNPALVVEREELCPECGHPLRGFFCPACGFHPSTGDEKASIRQEDWEEFRNRRHEAEGSERFSGVASRRSWRDDAIEQWRIASSGEERRIGERLIETLDDDGYFTEPLIDLSQTERLSVPQIEAVLRRVQELDPAGIGARNLRECLLLQCARREDDGCRAALPRRIIEEAWEDLASRRPDRIADRLREDLKTIEDAVDWIRRSLVPYPCRNYRNDWDHLTPRTAAKVAPDIVIRREPDGFRIEIAEASGYRFSIDPEYRRLYKSLTERKGGRLRPEYDHVHRSIESARLFIHAVEQRRRTMLRVMTAVVEVQSPFLLYGKSHLKPLTQKSIAARLGLHESTVCRALADKLVRLPSGETVSTVRFFDDATPVKEALEELIAREDPTRPLSDDRLAQLLIDKGYPIARRTVAKYRDALKIPPAKSRLSIDARSCIRPDPVRGR